MISLTSGASQVLAVQLNVEQPLLAMNETTICPQNEARNKVGAGLGIPYANMQLYLV
jgi:hypothetical protein